MSIEFTVLSASAKGLAEIGSRRLHGEMEDRGSSLKTLEQSGVSAVIVDHSDGVFRNFEIAAEILKRTSTLRVVLTHWAGVMDPFEAARHIALLSQPSQGRLALRILPNELADSTGGPSGQSKAWERADEYLRLVRRIWLNDAPFDHEGAFYSLRGCYCPSKPFHEVPVWIGDLSSAALKTVGRHASVVELPSAKVEEVEFLVRRIQASAAEVGRSHHVRFAMPVQLSPDRFAEKAYGDMRVRNSSNGLMSLVQYARAGVTIFNIEGDIGELDLFRRRRLMQDEIGAASPKVLMAFSETGRPGRPFPTI